MGVLLRMSRHSRGAAFTALARGRRFLRGDCLVVEVL